MPSLRDMISAFTSLSTREPTSAALTYYLPYEITSKIISYVVEDGLRISNHEVESNLKSIKALLHTSKAIKKETLRQVLDQPLHLRITSKKTCSCELPLPTPNPRGVVFPICNNAGLDEVPLRQWTQLVIYFDPTMSDALDLSAWQTFLSEVQHGNGERARFTLAAAIVAHYSQGFAAQLCSYHDFVFQTYAPGFSLKERFPELKFVFVTPPPALPVSTADAMPLWSMHLVHNVLSDWKRLLRRPFIVHRFKLPRTIMAGPIRPVVHPFKPFKSTADELSEKLRQDFSQQWYLSADLFNPEEDLYYDAIHFFKYTVNHLEQHSVRRAELISDIANGLVLYVTIPDENSQDSTTVTWTGELFTEMRIDD